MGYGLLILLLIGGCSFLRNSNNSFPSSGNEQGEHLLLDENWSSSKVFDRKFEDRFNQIEEYRKRTLTHSDTDLFLAKPEGPLNNLVADMLRWYVGRLQGEQTDIGFVPYRYLADSIPAGPVQVEDVFRVTVENPRISLYQVNGVVIQQLADTIAARGGGAVSGLRMRIVDGRAMDVLVGAQSIRPNDLYRLAAPSGIFCKNGGDLPIAQYGEWPVTIVGIPVQMNRVVPEIDTKHILDKGLRQILIEYLDDQTVINRMLDQRLR